MARPLRRPVNVHRLLLLSGAIGALLVSPRLPAQTTGSRPSAAHDAGSGTSVFLEEDNLQAHPHTDRNYTMGLGVQFTGPWLREPHAHVRPDFALEALDRAAGFLYSAVTLGKGTYPALRPSSTQLTTGMISGTAFTPVDIRNPDVTPGDRPYAFLLGWTVRRARVNHDSTAAWTSEATLGTIGSPLGHWVQSGIHWTIRSLTKRDSPFDPKGWHHQILDSPTGIPTARYALSYERVIKGLDWPATEDRMQHYLQATWLLQGQLGYYTEGDAGAQVRLGRFSTPFWGFQADPLGGGNKGAVNPSAQRQPLEWFVFGRGAARFVGYNALLQGYGHWLSDYVLPTSAIVRTIGEYDYGATLVYRDPSRRSRSYSVTWVRDAMRTAEFKGPYRRSHYWGGIYLTWTR